MDKIINKPVYSLVILAVLSWYLFFFQLGNMALTDPDETFYAQTAKEMLQRNDWVTPHLFDKPQFEKPPFYYWLTAGSFKIFGINEFAARFPSAVFGLIGVIVIYFLGTLFFNKRVGLLSGLILATNVEYVALSRGCLTDIVLNTMMLLGVTFFFYGYVREKKYFYILAAASLGLATLTKGPIGIVLPLMALMVYVIWARDWGIFKKIPWFWASVVFLVVAAPWYLLAYKLHGRTFIDSFFGFQNVNRFFESEHKIGSQFYYNIPVVFAGFFPWSAFLPLAFWRILKRVKYTSHAIRYEHRYLVFILSWFAVIFLFFTASSTKLPTYIFPCWVSLALAVAFIWDEFLAKGAPEGLIRGVKISYNVMLAAVFIGSIGALVFIKIDYPDVFKSALAPALALILGFGLSAAAFFNKKNMQALFMIALTLAAFLYAAERFVTPQIGLHESSREIAKELKKRMKPGEELGSESHYARGLAFYTGKIPVDLDKHHLMIPFLESEKRVWFVLKEKNHVQIYTNDTPPFCYKPSYAVYKLGKRVIATNEIPDDGKYLVKRDRV